MKNEWLTAINNYFFHTKFIVLTFNAFFKRKNLPSHVWICSNGNDTPFPQPLSYEDFDSQGNILTGSGPLDLLF